MCLIWLVGSPLRAPVVPIILGCFSMIQWVIDQHGLEYGKQVLRAVSEHARELLFDVSVNQGKSCLRCTPGNELQHLPDFLESSTCYTEITHLGDVHPYGSDTRHVFLCRRQKHCVIK